MCVDHDDDYDDEMPKSRFCMFGCSFQRLRYSTFGVSYVIVPSTLHISGLVLRDKREARSKNYCCIFLQPA